MANNTLFKFEVRITDIETGEEKYFGFSNCIFLASSEDGGNRLIRLSSCDILTKATCYYTVKYGLDNTLKNDPFLDALVPVFSRNDVHFIVKEEDHI